MTINYAVHCVALGYVHLIKCVRIDSSTLACLFTRECFAERRKTAHMRRLAQWQMNGNCDYYLS